MVFFPVILERLLGGPDLLLETFRFLDQELVRFLRWVRLPFGILAHGLFDQRARQRLRHHRIAVARGDVYEARAAT